MCDDHHEDCGLGHGDFELDDPLPHSFDLRFEQAGHHATKVSSCKVNFLANKLNTKHRVK